MRKMIYAYRTSDNIKSVENLIPQQENLYTMFLKNKETIQQTSPRFLNVLYEYSSVIPRKWTKAILEIENCIVENINTMPLPAVKSFVYHMGNVGAYNINNLNKVLNILIQRDLFQDSHNTRMLLNSL